MPNHCQNTITITGERGYLEDFIYFHLTNMENPLNTDDLSDNMFTMFSFESVLPRPKELEDISSGACTIDGKSHRVWRRINGKNVAIPDDEYTELKEKYGATNLYDWCIDNWSTKWDAYDFSMETNINSNLWHQPVFVPYNDATTFGMEGKAPFYMLQMSFTTAWSPPENVFYRLSEMNPRLLFCNKWEEEGGMEGEQVFLNGDCIFEDGRQTGYEIYSLTDNYQHELRKLSDNNYASDNNDIQGQKD